MERSHRVEIRVSREEAGRLREAAHRQRAGDRTTVRIAHMESFRHIADRCSVRLWLDCNGSVQDPEQEVRRLLQRR